MADKDKIEKLETEKAELEKDLRDLTIRFNTLAKSPAEEVELNKVMSAKSKALQSIKDELSKERLS